MDKSSLIDLEGENPDKGEASMSKLTAAYIAGFIDGEGYIGLYQRKQGWYGYILSVANTDKEIIYWFRNSFGGRIWTKRFQKGTDWKEQYWWSLDNKKQLDWFLLKIIPYLRIKKRQAILLRKFIKTLDKYNYQYERDDKGRIVRRTILPEVEEKRANLHQEVKQLNRRGHILHPERLSEKTPDGEATV